MISVLRKDLDRFLEISQLVGDYTVSVENIRDNEFVRNTLDVFYIEDAELDALIDWAFMFRPLGDETEDPIVLFSEMKRQSEFAVSLETIRAIALYTLPHLHEEDIMYLVDEFKSVFEHPNVSIENLPELLKFFRDCEI